MVARRALLPRAPSHLALPKKPTRVSYPPPPAPTRGATTMDGGTKPIRGIVVAPLVGAREDGMGAHYD
jgi:hypothetical protein